MERPKYRFLILASVWMICFLPLAGQGQSSPAQQRFQDMIYRAYVYNNMTLWESTLSTMEFELERRPSEELMYDVLLAQYGLIGYYLGTDENNKARRTLDKAESLLDRFDASTGSDSRGKLFRSAFLAFRIGLRSWQAVTLGPRSQRLIDEALEMDPGYPMGWIEKGNLMFFAPPIFGGSKTESIQYYSRAVEILEGDMPNNLRWIYLSTLVSLANAYEKTDQLDHAIRVLEKALEFEPDFMWVKEEMMPEFLSKKQKLSN